MLKALAVLRTLFLFAIAGYTAWAMPWSTHVARTFDEQYARCANALSPLQKATWLAVAWIALEVVVGWMVVWKNAHADRSELKKALKEAKSGQTLPPEGPPAGH